jgi:mono/diheme cytochrome c family protein
MQRFLRLTILLLLLGAGALAWWPAASIESRTREDKAELARQFNQTIRPFLTTYCAGCHSGAEPAASFDVQRYATLSSVVEDFGHWALIQRKLTAREMPPKEMRQPSEAARQQVIEWIAAVRKHEINKHPGDPGLVAARRLSNAEYNYTVRDLTGVDLRPAKEFPIDPANQAGFDNSGESLTISPALMAKYLDAARRIADHLVLKPEGFTFASHPMVAESDREKYPIQRIVAFYDRQPTDFADYFYAAWRYQQRKALGQGVTTLNEIAKQQKVSPRYLPLIWQTLEQTQEDVGPLVKLQAMWRALPANDAAAARQGCEQMRDFVVKIRRHTEKLFPTLESPGFSTNYQPIVMYRNALLAAHRRDFDPTALRVEGEPPVKDFVVTQGPPFGNKEIQELKNNIAAYIKERQEAPDLMVPAGARARYEAAFARFSRVFPTAFFLKERGRFYPINTMDRERYLGAGLHSAVGYFRDDTPLIELILDEKGKQELETLWHEFEFIGDYTLRNYTQFIGSGARTMKVNRDQHQGFATTEAILALREQTLKRANAQTDPRIIEAIQQYFDNANTRIRVIEKARLAAEPRHLDALLQFAARAYRRPLTQPERDDILNYYRQARAQSRLTHEEAMRASITSLLVSPDFLYRVDLVDAQAKTNANTFARPLSAYSLASRLSYFLWSSMPDDELLAHAAAGDLDKSAVLLAQVRRMLKDERARGLATEFAGNWLDFRRFEDHNAVDRERFPAFTNQLREAMFEEPIRFITDALQRDRPVQELLYGKHTFVNGVLARHYGIPVKASEKPDDWFRVDNANEYGRGGLLPMAVFLTQNAPGQRTSPVKRGYWVVRRVLGEVIPPPPPTVPELPRDEATSNLSVREMLAKHRDNKACAGCHARFDAFGLVFEGFGPIGERRANDLAGRAVDARAAFPDGTNGAGIAALQTYLRARREPDYLNNLSEKLLAFALGRSLMITDEPLLETMRAQLAANGFRMSALIETIVTSPQFRNKRALAYQPTRAPQKGTER